LGPKTSWWAFDLGANDYRRPFAPPSWWRACVAWSPAGVWSDVILGFLIAGTIVLCILLTVVFSAIAVVVRGRNKLRARRWSVLEDRWEPAVLEALDGARTAESVRSLVRERDALLFVDYVSRFARRVGGKERDLLAELAAPWLPRLAQRLTHRDEATRARAVQTISLLGLSGYAGRLVRALDDRSPLVAMAAARALASRERTEFAPQVLRRLPRFARWRPSFVSAMLTEMGPDAVPDLLAAFADPGQPAEARAIVADALNALHVLEAADIAQITWTGTQPGLGRRGPATALRDPAAPSTSPRFAHRSPARDDMVRTGAIVPSARSPAGRAGAADPGPRRPVALGCTSRRRGHCGRSERRARSAHCRNGTTRTRSSRPKYWRRAPDGPPAHCPRLAERERPRLFRRIQRLLPADDAGGAAGADAVYAPSQDGGRRGSAGFCRRPADHAARARI
jgi:hypothetical protein